MSRLPSVNQQKGFTLIELIIVVAAMGVVLVIFANAYGQVGALRAEAERERLAFQNMQVGRALMEFAQKTDGRLPQAHGGQIPLAGTRLGSDKETLLEALWGRGMTEDLALTDGTRAQNTRHYRVLIDSVESPLFGSSGDSVTLEVDYAALFFANDDDDVTFNLGSFDPRTIGLEDALESKMFVFSSRSHQDEKLRATAVRLQRIRQALNNYVTMQRLQAPPSELLTANFLPGSSGGGASLNCGGGWKTLSASNALVAIGLNSTEFMETAWGAPIFYCRNYGARSAAPYYGALAITKDVNDTTTSLPSEHVVINL